NAICISFSFFSFIFTILNTMKPICKDIENCIIQCLESGNSYRTIGKVVGVSRATVQRVANKMFPGRSIEKKCRPPKSTERDKLYCVRQITTCGKETAVDVVKSLKKDLIVSVHVDTVQNALHEKGFGAIVKPKKPNLSPKNVKDRLVWAI